MPELTLADFQDADLPLGEMIGGRMDHIHDYFLDFEYELVDALPPDDGDVVILIDSAHRRSKLEQLASYKGRVVLVAAPTDGPFWKYSLPSLQKLPDNLAAAFVVNNDIPDPRVTNVPLGVRKKKVRRCQLAKRDNRGPRGGLLYGNFNLNPAIYGPDESGIPHVRQRLAEQFERAPWATLDVAAGIRPSDAALEAYYASLANHKFVLSPEGLGADCYRHWESLYLGTIPIVRTSQTMTNFAELPILFTDDYSEISEAYLNEQWERFNERRFELTGLLKSHYRERFLKSVAQLPEPRFLCWGFRGTSEERFLDAIAWHES
jgi:hypothetical protein